MKIIRRRCAEGARKAEGVAVVIDVFRAFSCAPLFFHFGAKKVILEAEVERAQALKRADPASILVGEVNEVPIEGADLGNSPSRIIQKGTTFFKGKTVIHRTTAGVTGASAAYETADEVIVGSFVMARAIADYVRQKKAAVLTLVSMGERAERKAPEDEACADYLEHLLTGKPYDPAGAFKEIVFQHTAQKFIFSSKAYLPPEDPIFCLQRDLFDFALKVERVGENLEVLKIGLSPD